MGNPKGVTKSGGRRKGSLNKVTATVKETVLDVFRDMGGLDTMTKWALDNQTDFYRLFAKLLPLQVDAEIKHVTDRLSDAELTNLIIADKQKKEDQDNVVKH